MLGATFTAWASASAASAATNAPTFEQIMQAPDDVDLNIAYARSMADSGQLLGAAAALERVLMLKPNAASVRLLYAVVLYRLDDLQGANAQLALVDGAQLPPLERAELEKYRRVVNSGRKNTKFNGQLSAGFAYNSDALGALEALFDNTGKIVPHKSGTQAVFSGALDGSTKLNDDFELYGILAGFSRSDVSGPDDRLQYISGEIGLKQTLLKGSWQIGAIANNYWLLGNSYLSEYGGRALATWNPNTSITLNASFEAVSQDFRDPLIDLFKSFLGGTGDGARYAIQGGATYRMDAHSSLRATVGYEMKDAGYRPFAYNAPFVGAGYRGLLGSGVYLDIQADYRWVDYRAVDKIFLSPLKTKRQDRSESIRASLGVPLSAFSRAGATADMLEDLTLEGSLSYAARSRPSPLADYSGLGAELRLVWSLGDGR